MRYLPLLLLLSLGCITIERPLVIEPQRCECACPDQDSGCPPGETCWHLSTTYTTTGTITDGTICANCFDFDEAATAITGTWNTSGDCCDPHHPTDETCMGCDDE